MKLVKRLLLGILVLILLATGGDFAARILAERDLEELFQRRQDVDHAVVRLESWPYLLHARNESFPRVTLIVTLKQGSFVTYDPLVFHLRDVFVRKTSQCPAKLHYIYAWEGDGHAVLPERFVERLLRGQRGLEDVRISEEEFFFTTPSGTRHSVTESAASIRPNDVSGNIVLGGRKEVVILLSEVFGQVKFQDVRFEEGALIAPFTVKRPAFCV